MSTATPSWTSSWTIASSRTFEGASRPVIDSRRWRAALLASSSSSRGPPRRSTSIASPRPRPRLTIIPPRPPPPRNRHPPPLSDKSKNENGGKASEDVLTSMARRLVRASPSASTPRPVAASRAKATTRAHSHSSPRAPTRHPDIQFPFLVRPDASRRVASLTARALLSPPLPSPIDSIAPPAWRSRARGHQPEERESAQDGRPRARARRVRIAASETPRAQSRRRRAERRVRRVRQTRVRVRQTRWLPDVVQRRRRAR